MYSKKVMKYFTKPRHAKKLKDFNGVGKVGNPQCGDIMKIFIKVKKNKKGKEIIKDISFLTFGCVAAISSSEVLCNLAKDKTLEQAERIAREDIIVELGELPAVKHHCSVLAADGLRRAIEDYKKKKSLNTEIKKG